MHFGMECNGECSRFKVMSYKYDYCFGQCLSLVSFKHNISEAEVSYEKPPGLTTDMSATLIIATRRGRLVTGSLDWPADLGHL